MTAQVVGFTGTQHGMNLLQEKALGELLVELGAESLHHGCCIGADAQAHAIAKKLGLHVVGHPPTNTYKMADLDCDVLRDPEPFLDRNHSIVDEVDVMAATPQELKEILRSGTWATVRYARKTKVELYVLLADGSVVHERQTAPNVI